MNQTVLITGGTGLIGMQLSIQLIAAGYKVIILSRKPGNESRDDRISYALWSIEEQKIDEAAISKADFIIHLAGAGVMDKKWTEDYKKEIIESRTSSSQLLIKGLSEFKNKVKAIIVSSAIGWYGGDEKLVIHKKGFIETDPAATDFLGETCRLWEESIEPVKEFNIRLARFRIGIVLSNDGGAFPEFTKPVKLGIAAILGNGKQVISWIHIDDLCRLFIHAIKEDSIKGTYNAVAPLPVTNKKLVLKIADRLRKSFYIPIHVPSLLLRMMMGERSVEILKSTTVDSAKIQEEGFIFNYPSIDAALDQLCGPR